MKTIVDRLKEYLDYKGISPSVAETEINVSNGTLSKPFNAGTTIKTNTLEKFLSVYTDIDSEWLLTGRGNMLNKNDDIDIFSVLWQEVADDRKYTIEIQKEKIKSLEGIIDKLKKAKESPFYPGMVAEPKVELKK